MTLNYFDFDPLLYARFFHDKKHKTRGFVMRIVPYVCVFGMLSLCISLAPAWICARADKEPVHCCVHRCWYFMLGDDALFLSIPFQFLVFVRVLCNLFMHDNT